MGFATCSLPSIFPTLSPSPAADYRGIIKRYVRPKFGKWKISELSRPDLRKLLIEIDDKFPTRAGAVMRVSGSMYNTARDKEWIPDSVINPAAGIKLPKLVARDHVLTDPELVAIWNATDALGHPFGPIVKLFILTGQRREDVSGMRWAEIDFDQKVWNIPGNRTKDKHAHVVPLSPEELAVIATLPHSTDANFVFRTTGDVSSPSGFSRAKANMDKLIKQAKVRPWRMHDIRRSFCTGLAQLGVDVIVAEKLLNHVGESLRGIVGVYQRHEDGVKKSAAMELWGRHVAGLISGKQLSAEVVPIGKGRK